MTGFLYVLADFLRANLRSIPVFLGWAAAVALTLGSATALLFLPLGGGSPTLVAQELLVLTLDPLLSEAEINRLAWAIAAWPETLRVNFRFPGEADPEPLGERALVVEARPGSREVLMARVAKLAGIRKVAALERRAVQPGLPPPARLAALSALGLGLAAAVLLGLRATRRALLRWQKEREILRLAGLSPLYWQGPVWVLGVLVGVAGAGLFALGLHLGLRLAPAVPALEDLARRAAGLCGLAFPVGALLGLVTAALRPHS